MPGYRRCAPGLMRSARADGAVPGQDLGDPIGWLPDGCVDLVLCALAIEYVDDRVSALRELRRVLRPGGALVLSRQHPTGDWLRHGGSYFDVRVISGTWDKGWQVRYWLAPLETTCKEIAAAPEWALCVLGWRCWSIWLDETIPASGGRGAVIAVWLRAPARNLRGRRSTRPGATANSAVHVPGSGRLCAGDAAS
jgi:SAM-dependent methyltransferase